MKKGFFKITVLSLVTVLTFSACGAEKQAGEPAKDPKEVVKEGFVNLGDAKSANYELTLSGSSTDTSGEAGSLDFSLNGTYNNSVRENPEFSINFDVNGEMEGADKQNANGEIRVVGGSIYFMINELSDFMGALPQELVASYVGKWWSMVLPPEYNDILGSYTGDEADMTPEEKKLKELFENAEFFTDLEFAGIEEVGGSDAYKYKATLNDEGILAYMQAFSDSQGGIMTEADLNDMREALALIDFDGSVWIGVDDMTFRKVAGDINISPDSETGESGSMSFSYGVTDVNEDLHVEVPSGAQEFDPLSLLMGMSAGGGLGDVQL